MASCRCSHWRTLASPSGAGRIGEALSSDVGLGVILGLVVGKPAGIVLFAWLATALGLATLPAGVRWAQLAAVSVLGGLGFTVSLFVTELAFADAALLKQAKIGIGAASLLAGAAGYVALRLVAGGGGRD